MGEAAPATLSPTPTFFEILTAIYGPGYNPASIHRTYFAGDPHDKQQAHWHGSRVSSLGDQSGTLVRWRPDINLNHYLCMGVLDPNTTGRSLAHVIGHVAIWMDDVGTKVPRERVEDFIAYSGLGPTLVAETSPGNFSYIWALNSVVPADGGFDDQTVAAIRSKLKSDGWGDPVCQEAARYMRFGVGINGKKSALDADGKPFQTRLELFDPGSRHSLTNMANYMLGQNWREDVASGHYQTSAQLAAQMAGGGAGGSNERRATMNDPLVRLAAEIGLDPAPSTRAGVIDCRCPNEAAHTGGDTTGYAIINDGMSYCNHASCQHLNSRDFQDMMVDQYNQMIAAGVALGAYVENPFGPGLMETATGSRIAVDGTSFLAAARFEGVGVGEIPAGAGPDVARAQALAEAEEIAARSFDKDEAREQAKAALFERFVHVDAAEVFWDRKFFEMVPPSRVDKDEEVIRVFGTSAGNKRGSVQLLNSVGRLKHVSKTAIIPYRADRVPSSDIVAQVLGNGTPIEVVNTFRPTKIGFKPGTPKAFLDHLDWLFAGQPDAKQYLLEYMAFCVQHPEVQTSVIVMLGGAPGIGKDGPVLTPFFKLLGTHNVTTISSAQRLSSEFNDFLQSPMIYMSEFALPHGENGAYSRLKEFTSPTDDVEATINPKYGKTYKIKVQPKFIATTNDDDALGPVTNDDRRVAVLWSNAVPLPGTGHGSGPGTDPYFAQLMATMQDPDELAILHHYLMNLPITVFDPHKAPPRTSQRHEKLVSSLPALSRFVYDLMVYGDFAERELVSYAEIEARCVNAESRSISNNVSPKAISRGLAMAGSKKIARVRDGKHFVQIWTGSCVVINGQKYAGALDMQRQKDLSLKIGSDLVAEWKADTAKAISALMSE